MKIKPRLIFLFIPLFALLLCSSAPARPTSQYEAEEMVKGWLSLDPQPLGTIIGRSVADVETFTDDYGEPLYYIVHMQPAGFVIVPADDLVEPIICFAGDGSLDLTSENPLTVLLNVDLAGRVASARADYEMQADARLFAVSEKQRKWNSFISAAQAREQGTVLLSIGSISDLRVAPLVRSKWGQANICGKNCYNYYTPKHYLSGCVATAMAQLMLYNRHPAIATGVQQFQITVDGEQQTAFTLGGDCLCGPYLWNLMTLEPDCLTTEEQCRAIGALCYDAGVSINMEYTADWSSGDMLKAGKTLLTVFNYSNVITGYDHRSDVSPVSLDMINPNLDYGSPVILGLWDNTSGHAVLCDGYGYNASTLYHHLNMGWSGANDAWYNLPDVNSTPSYKSVAVCLYNIFVTGSGEIISGRVIDAFGAPISNVTITAKGKEHIAITNDKGIYALAKVPSASKFTISAEKADYLFADQMVTTGKSGDREKSSGNRWGIDFVGVVAGDYDGDNDIDAADFATYAQIWLTGLY